MRDEFKFFFDLPAVFIDTFHNTKVPQEVTKFQEETTKLWRFAEKKIDSPFHCKDIEVVIQSVYK